jgi:hypothetical protein
MPAAETVHIFARECWQAECRNLNHESRGYGPKIIGAVTFVPPHSWARSESGKPTAAMGLMTKSNRIVTILSCHFAGKSPKAFDYFDICLIGEKQTTKNLSSIDIV